MKEALQDQAKALGFDACRFTTADPPPHADEFASWLEDKRHGEMAYLERNAFKRVDPQKVLPGARTIITLAASYAPPPGSGEPAQSRSDRGVMARYARFNDYHDVLGEKLKELAGFLQNIAPPQTRSLWYVDTGPLLERDLAERSGLGFIGKHASLISRRLGNWFFLAEIITTAAIEPDPSETNHCGKCTRCLEACPTRAITAPFQLDARRCISYLTIELKGPIPEEFRPALGSRIFGCDDCLEACPWNRFAREAVLMKRHYRSDLAQPDLLGLLRLDQAGFKRKFAGTPMLRTKRRGLLRNVCVALGNAGKADALPALEKAAREDEPLVAEHAQWAIQRIEGRS